MHARSSGVPVARATITLVRANGSRVASTQSAGDGSFVFANAAAGTYRVVAVAAGFQPTVIAITLEPADRLRLTFDLAPLDDPHEIGRIVVRTGRASASSDRTVSAETIAASGALRTTDALATLPGVTVTGDAGSPGGDAYASIRGLRPGESETLLDGHPIGPIGVEPDSPDADGTIAGFNFQDAPYFALRDVDVSFGAASDRGGNDALGGTIDLRTLDPTPQRRATLEQGFGNQGRALTDVTLTGTTGRLGYALVSGVVGTYGAFAGAPIAQTGLRGTDFTSATLGALTYHVSGDYTLRNDLAKLVYAISPSTRLIATAYDATSWADKTGEGDNDDNSPAYVLAGAPIGSSATCPHGVLVTTNAGSRCVTAAAYAAAASGPAGGGPGAWQALRNQDYDARLTTTARTVTYMLDAYVDDYAELYHRDASIVNGPLDTFLDRWSTQGVRASADAPLGNNLAGIDVSALRQTLDQNGTNVAGTALVDEPSASLDDERFALRDRYAPSRAFALTVDAPLLKSSLDSHVRFDPQAAIEYHPTAFDTFRAGAGRSSEEPSLQTARTNLLPAGALNPDCGAIARGTAASPADVNVGSAPADRLAPETGTDLEFGYAHRFAGDGGIDVTFYETGVRDRIVTGDFAAGPALGNTATAPFLARIEQFCGTTPAPGAVDFTLSRSFNAATARLRGIELSGHAPLSPRIALDYGYDVQSSVLDDLPNSVLATNPTLVNGLQEFDVPLHKATLAIAAALSRTLDARLIGHFVGIGNPQQLPGYAYADASIERTISAHATLHVAIANVLGSHVGTYGLVGMGIPYATNAQNQAISAPYLQPFNERYGLSPTTVTVTATAHI